jgi:hypothetical protein
MAGQNGQEYIRIKDGFLEIRARVGKGVPSSTGRTLVIASSRGNVDAEGQHDGKAVKVGFNAYVK